MMVKPLKIDPALLLAFFAIYVLWGSTYLAIRIAVESVPPFFAAAVRFLIAGAALYPWARLRGELAPTRRQWKNLVLLGGLMFLAPYGGLFWAEKTLASGIAAVLVATIPFWTAMLQIFVFRRERMRWAVLVSITLGVGGVMVLALGRNEGHMNWPACLAILGSEISWATATVLTTFVDLPRSKLVSAGGQMLFGGAMLLICAGLFGELQPVPHVSLRAAAAIVYLIVAGSLLAFTAYVWLLGRVPATTVTSYAYVNPVVALFIGHWLGNEALGTRTIVGSALVLASVGTLLKRERRTSVTPGNPTFKR
jgi:drug/metabolite transporter (DMT)-like permease